MFDISLEGIFLQKFLMIRRVKMKILFKIVFLYIDMDMKVKVAWSVDHESTHVDTFYNVKVKSVFYHC